MNYKITVSGCDDSTLIVVALTEDEFKLIESIAGKISAASGYSCQPVMSIKPFVEGESEDE